MWLLFALVCMIIILFLLTIILHSYHESERITCIMITGGDPAREKYVKLSIQNFREQSHKDKHLVIINHGPESMSSDIMMMYNVTEINIDKTKNTTLGDLRNLAFEYVPYNGLFCVWDDDDYRSPDFLKIMYRAMRSNAASAVCFTRRLEYNLNNGFGWETFWNAGFVHVLARKYYAIKYESKDTMEDLRLLQTMRSVYNVHTISDNDPRMYVRLIHRTNTSLYVDVDKSTTVGEQSPNWHEYALSSKYKRYIEKVYLPKIS